ncbi:vitellogenic carboxypeptidase-like isoform X2 [Pectinophora gossypiella]|uniref:vitellogenic carboxypeptidase-like isoform X2 n=1 Tax=Pectinophora gossypiella TaxID=13191 RepID=UPI00214ED569|nr:vitellogenic carboxypeptidase-like isoform X2 [Pectinophora gossypiella]
MSNSYLRCVHFNPPDPNGILDLFVPYSLSKRALFSDMQWSQREQYASSLRKPMRLNSDGRVVAYTKAGGNFMEVLIRGAGHMVPKENPYVANVNLLQCHACESSPPTPEIKSDNATSPRDKFKVNPDKFLGIESYSGFLTVKEGNHLFFWYFPKEDAGNTPWIIWLNGGPGVSSLLGLFDFIGPLEIKNGEVSLRNTTWASNYSLLFIDSPVGAGFSYTEREDGYPTSSAEVAKQLYSFLEKFIEVFPELSNAPLFIAGSSYAGKYVPSLGIEIHRHNDSQPIVKLKGIAMGNALIHPPGMIHYSLLMRELGLMDDEPILELMEYERNITRLIDGGCMVKASNKYNETIEFIKKMTDVSIYNFEHDPSVIQSTLEEFVKQPEIKELIHAGNGSFHLNNQLVYQKMLPDIMNTTKPLVEELLEHYGVMCYIGQYDLFIPYSLSKRVFKDLQWSQREQYANAPRKRLRHNPDGHVVAYKKAGGNFVDIMIRGAGHMAPKDKPHVAKFIIDSFIQQFQ